MGKRKGREGWTREYDIPPTGALGIREEITKPKWGKVSTQKLREHLERRYVLPTNKYRGAH